MKHTWASQIKSSLEELGFSLHKRECDGHWQLSLDEEWVDHSRSMGDVLNNAAKEFNL